MPQNNPHPILLRLPMIFSIAIQVYVLVQHPFKVTNGCILIINIPRER